MDPTSSNVYISGLVGNSTAQQLNGTSASSAIQNTNKIDNNTNNNNNNSTMNNLVNNSTVYVANSDTNAVVDNIGNSNNLTQPFNKSNNNLNNIGNISVNNSTIQSRGLSSNSKDSEVNLSFNQNNTNFSQQTQPFIPESPINERSFSQNSNIPYGSNMSSASLSNHNSPNVAGKSQSKGLVQNVLSQESISSMVTNSASSGNVYTTTSSAQISEQTNFVQNLTNQKTENPLNTFNPQSDKGLGNLNNITLNADDDDTDDEEHKVIETDPTGRYERYSECLGRGAYKEVYKAFDTEEGVEVAWNQLRLDSYSMKVEAQRILGEIRILESLRNDNIINLYYTWVAKVNGKERIYFITELMTSGTLRGYIKKTKGPIKLKVLKNWCRQILSGLNYLHTRSPPIIHRDLKCDNIFINGNNGQAKIGDLGLAVTKVRDHVSSVLGTPEFMAPELYDEKYDEKVDIYAFGLMILEILTKEYPYSECANQAQIYKKVSSGVKPLGLKRILDDAVRDFISICIQFNPEDRPSAQELLNHPFLDPACTAPGAVVQVESSNPKVEDAQKLQKSQLSNFSSGESSDNLTEYSTETIRGFPKNATNVYSGESNGYDTSKGGTISTTVTANTSPVSITPQRNLDPILRCKVEVVEQSLMGEFLLKMFYAVSLDKPAQEIKFPFNIYEDTPVNVVSEMIREGIIEQGDGPTTIVSLEKAVNDYLIVSTGQGVSPNSLLLGSSYTNKQRLQPILDDTTNSPIIPENNISGINKQPVYNNDTNLQNLESIRISKGSNIGSIPINNQPSSAVNINANNNNNVPTLYGTSPGMSDYSIDSNTNYVNGQNLSLPRQRPSSSSNETDNEYKKNSRQQSIAGSSSLETQLQSNLIRPDSPLNYSEDGNSVGDMSKSLSYASRDGSFSVQKNEPFGIKHSLPSQTFSTGSSSSVISNIKPAANNNPFNEMLANQQNMDNIAKSTTASSTSDRNIPTRASSAHAANSVPFTYSDIQGISNMSSAGILNTGLNGFTDSNPTNYINNPIGNSITQGNIIKDLGEKDGSGVSSTTTSSSSLTSSSSSSASSLTFAPSPIETPNIIGDSINLNLLNERRESILSVQSSIKSTESSQINFTPAIGNVPRRAFTSSGVSSNHNISELNKNTGTVHSESFNEIAALGKSMSNGAKSSDASRQSSVVPGNPPITIHSGTKLSELFKAGISADTISQAIRTGSDHKDRGTVEQRLHELQEINLKGFGNSQSSFSTANHPNSASSGNTLSTLSKTGTSVNLTNQPSLASLSQKTSANVANMGIIWSQGNSVASLDTTTGMEPNTSAHAPSANVAISNRAISSDSTKFSSPAGRSVSVPVALRSAENNKSSNFVSSSFNPQNTSFPSSLLSNNSSKILDEQVASPISNTQEKLNSPPISNVYPSSSISSNTVSGSGNLPDTDLSGITTMLKNYQTFSSPEQTPTATVSAINSMSGSAIYDSSQTIFGKNPVAFSVGRGSVMSTDSPISHSSSFAQTSPLTAQQVGFGELSSSSVSPSNSSTIQTPITVRHIPSGKEILSFIADMSPNQTPSKAQAISLSTDNKHNNSVPK